MPDGADAVRPGQARERLVGLLCRQLQQVRAELRRAEDEDVRHRRQLGHLGGAFGVPRVDDQRPGLDVADDGGLGGCRSAG
ncbi:hypothetical protein ACFY0R_26675 [Streptomyces sp. NPDC001633]|uniref:hypothetical protein n=1 Tax=Streptomyces sp. NPDC001633 TaxID=3364595 RepID=UPI003692EC76